MPWNGIYLKTRCLLTRHDVTCERYIDLPGIWIRNFVMIHWILQKLWPLKYRKYHCCFSMGHTFDARNMGYMSDSEQCSNRLELYLISLLINFSCELGQIITRYDFLWARLVILSNVRTDLYLTLFHCWSTCYVNWGKYWQDITSYWLDEWFWAMFELTWTWPNFTFSQLFMWIGANNYQIWLPMAYMSGFWAKFELSPPWPNFTFGQLCMWIGGNND